MTRFIKYVVKVCYVFKNVFPPCIQRIHDRFTTSGSRRELYYIRLLRPHSTVHTFIVVVKIWVIKFNTGVRPREVRL
jgi:hypothetical protein